MPVYCRLTGKKYENEKEARKDGCTCQLVSSKDKVDGKCGKLKGLVNVEWDEY